MQKLIILATVAALLAGSCSPAEKGEDEKDMLTVSILPQKYFVEQIAGDNFDINVMVPRGASPETFEPAARQMKEAANSKAFFITGHLLFEKTLMKNIKSQNKDVKFVDTSRDVELIADDVADHGDHAHIHGADPHIWISLKEAEAQLSVILETIAEIDPDNEQYYRDNHERFISKIRALDEELTSRFKNAKGNSFLIYHPALSYFARDYGLQQISVEDHGKSPTPSHMKKIIDSARKKGLKDVFIQKEFERDNARAVARELGGDVIEVDPLSENWLENMEDMAEKILATLNR